MVEGCVDDFVVGEDECGGVVLWFEYVGVIVVEGVGFG